MKKISLLVLLCMILSLVFAACDPIEDTHVCAFGETWSFDATNHYHACKSCNAQSDVAKHADENNDGACDECAFILSSDHTFASEWTTDALNHWHASLCGHDVVDAKAAHTANALGVCSVCGVKVSSLTVDTVEDAIELALRQDYAAKSGTVFYSHQQYDYEWEEWLTVDTMSYFEKSEGYLHAIEYGEYLETWYYAVGDGIWSVINVNGEFLPNYNEYSIDNLNGYYFNGAILGYSDSAKAYGAADLIDALYFLGEEARIPLETEVLTVEGETVYGFSFGIPYYAGIYLVQVNFTLDQTAYFVDDLYVGVATVEEGAGVTIKYVIGEDGDFLYDEDYNLVVESVDFDEGFEPDFSNYYLVSQSAEIKAVASPEEDVVTSFEVQDENGTAVQTVTMTVGNTVVLYVLPNGGNIALDPVTAIVTDAEGYETWSCYANAYDGALYISAYSAGDYLITLSTAAYSVTLNVSVAAPAVEYIEVGVYNTAYYEYVALTETTITVGSSFNFKALVNDYADDSYTITVDGAEGTFTVSNVYENINSFSASAVGTYTLTLTSESDASMTASLTVNVIENAGKTVASVLNGKYEALFSGMTLYEFTFTPDYEGATSGTLNVVDKYSNVIGGNYTYSYNDGAIEIVDAAFTLSLDADLNLSFNNGGIDLALVAVEGGNDEDIDPKEQLLGKTFTDGTYYLTFEYYEGDGYYATLTDVIWGIPTVGIYFSSYDLEGPNYWDEYQLILVEDEDASMGENPYADYTAYVTGDFSTVIFDYYGNMVEFTVYNPYA